jgi:predicted XRE-type DNA-binding protein
MSDTTRAAMKNDIAVKRGSGNVFADLGFSETEAELLQLKAQIVSTIGNLIREQRLTQSAAAVKMGLKQPDVSRLLDGRLDGFSLERLIALLAKLGQRVTLDSEPANENTPPGPRIIYAHA